MAEYDKNPRQRGPKARQQASLFGVAPLLALLLAGCAEQNDGNAAGTSASATGSDTAATNSNAPGSSMPAGPGPSMTVTTNVPTPSSIPTTTSNPPSSNTGAPNPSATTPPSTVVSTGGTGGAGSDGGLTGGGAGGAGSDGGNSGSASGGAENGGSENGGGGESGGSGGTAGRGGNAGSSNSSDGGASQGGNGAMPSYMPCPVNGDPCAVLPLGDSITEGYGSSGGGYRVELFRRALADDKNVTFVGGLMNGPDSVEGQPFPRRHEGHGGFTIDSGPNHNGISGQLTDQAIATYQPHIVLLMIGTNDLNGNFDVEMAPTRLGNLMDQIIEDAPDALLVLATIIPMTNGNNSKVGPYNEAMIELVASRAAEGKHVVLVDNNAAFSSDPNYATALMGDTLHPNDAGYAVLGASFYEAIGMLLGPS